MADKVLISVSASHITAARWVGVRLGPCTSFDNDDHGLAEFKEYLARTSHAPVHMLVDAVEEDYRFESLPHSFGSDRTEMLTRKLKQHYRNTPYCSARLQGRDEGKRRDDRYLFCALTNPELVAAWLQAVTEREYPVAGVYLLPTVTVGLVEKLKLKQPNLLVVSKHGSGLRLTFFRDQQLRLSRLARIDSGEGHADKIYAEEISNTRLYLHALRVMTLDEQLSVLIVDQDDSLTALMQAVVRDNPNIDCRHVGRREIVDTLGISGPSLDSSPDAFYLHLLGLQSPENNLAPANVTLGYRQHQLRRGIHALAGVSALAALVWCALSLYQIFDTHSETEIARRQTVDLQEKYQAATRQFPAAPTTPDNLRRAVEVSQRIGKTIRSPELMMEVVSQALDSNPSIVMKRFTWKYATTEVETGGDAKPTPDASRAVAPLAGSARKQSGLVQGEVRPFRGDYRAAIDAINQFATSLSQQPAVAEVKIVKLPLNISPSLTLSGNTLESHEQSVKAEFSVVIIIKPTA